MAEESLTLGPVKSFDRFFIVESSQSSIFSSSIVPFKATGWADIEHLDFSAMPELTDIVAGRVAGRDGDREITCFINNFGLGYQFAAVGALVYRKAKEAGAGRELPTEWFTEDVHP